MMEQHKHAIYGCKNEKLHQRNLATWVRLRAILGWNDRKNRTNSSVELRQINSILLSFQPTKSANYRPFVVVTDDYQNMGIENKTKALATKHRVAFNKYSTPFSSLWICQMRHRKIPAYNAPNDAGITAAMRSRNRSPPLLVLVLSPRTMILHLL